MKIEHLGYDNSTNPVRTFHFSVVFYILILCFSELINLDFIKIIANAVAIGVFVINLVNWAFYPAKGRLPSQAIVGLVVFYIGILGSSFFSKKQLKYQIQLNLLSHHSF